MRWKPISTAGLVALVGALVASCGGSTSNVHVYSGYADNLNTLGVRSTPPAFPDPWRGSSNVNFGGSGDRFDAGAVRLQNSSNDQLTVQRVTSDVGSRHYDLWGSNLKIPAKGSLVLTQTDVGPQNPPQPNFDSSEPKGAAPAGTTGNASAQGADVVPVIHVTIDGQTTDYRDTGKVLNTGGVDKGDLAGAPNESHNWQLLSAVGGSSQSGLSPSLFLAPLAALLLAFLSWIPKLIGALILLAIGWLVASVLARLVLGLLHRSGLAAAAERTGLFAAAGPDIARRSGGPASIFAQIVKWFVFLIFVSLAAEAVGLPQISALLHRIILWIPNLLVALLILVLGVVLARFLAGLTRSAAAAAGVGRAGVLARIVELAVIGLAAVVALTQIGVATLIIDILLMGVMLAVALAFGLAFGLGGRSVTPRMWQSARSTFTAPRERERVTSAADPDLPQESTAPTTTTLLTIKGGRER